MDGGGGGGGGGGDSALGEARGEGCRVGACSLDRGVASGQAG